MLLRTFCLLQEALLGGRRSRNSFTQYCLGTLSLLWKLRESSKPRGFRPLYLGGIQLGGGRVGGGVGPRTHSAPPYIWADIKIPCMDIMIRWRCECQKNIYTHIHICCFGLFRFIRIFKMPQCVACVHRERERDIYIYKHTHVYMWFHLHVPTSTCACSPPLSGCSSGRREAGASRLFFQILQFEPLPCDSTHPSAAFACARNDTFRPPPAQPSNAYQDTLHPKSSADISHFIRRYSEL